jgi:hypothetical protein
MLWSIALVDVRRVDACMCARVSLNRVYMCFLSVYMRDGIGSRKPERQRERKREQTQKSSKAEDEKGEIREAWKVSRRLLETGVVAGLLSRYRYVPTVGS